MNIWTGLLFLEGAVADASLASDLTADAADATPSASTTRQDQPGAAYDALAADRQFAGRGAH